MAVMKELLIGQGEQLGNNPNQYTTDTAPDYAALHGAALGCASMAAMNIRVAMQEAAHGDITCAMRWMLSALETLSIVTRRSELPQVEVPLCSES